VTSTQNSLPHAATNCVEAAWIFLSTSGCATCLRAPRRQVLRAGRRLGADAPAANRLPARARTQRGQRHQAFRRVSTHRRGLPPRRVGQAFATSALQTIPLARALLATGALPARAQADAAHVAIAAAAKTDYLLTWNSRHLANAQILRRLEAEASRLGWALPRICTPLELMGDSSYETESDP
jgi:hypothetical protein